MPSQRSSPPLAPHVEPFVSLLSRARAGEPAALDDLVERFFDRVEASVHRYLSRDLRVGRPWLAARLSTGDIVQEVFHSVIRDLAAFGGQTEDAFCGHVAMVIRNRVIDSIRFHEAACRDGRRVAAMPEGYDYAEDTGEVDPARVTERLEALRHVERSLADLDERTRLLVRARFEGLASFEALAQQLGYGSESTARRAFFDAQAQLALKLKDLRGEGEDG